MNKIISIEELSEVKAGSASALNGNNGSRLGFAQMITALGGYGEYDGFKVNAENETYLVLIENGQSCCESWGYMCSEDDPEQFVGADLLEVTLTDTALNQQKVEESGYYEDKGGIQFVDFKTNKGTYQLAVYNAHNGYYGRGIIVAKNDEILHQDVL